MTGWMKWLLVPAGLSLVLAFASARPAEAHRWGVRYGVPAPCYYPRRAYYTAPRVRVYREPVFVPRPVYRYRPYGVYYARPPWAPYHVW